MDKIIYVNRAQRFFEDKIDWKFYNYLTDIITPYEDKGYFVVIDIATYDYELNTKHIYFMGDDKQYKYLDNVFNAHILEKYYNSNGLVYLIYVFKNFEDGKIQYDILDEIYNKIKSRCHKVTIKDSKYCLCVSNSQVQ